MRKNLNGTDWLEMTYSCYRNTKWKVQRLMVLIVQGAHIVLQDNYCNKMVNLLKPMLLSNMRFIRLFSSLINNLCWYIVQSTINWHHSFHEDNLMLISGVSFIVVFNFNSIEYKLNSNCCIVVLMYSFIVCFSAFGKGCKNYRSISGT